MTDQPAVVHNEQEGRFEVKADGQLAVAEYDMEEGAIVFTHTVVPPELSGQGIANRLVKTGLDHARANGLKVVPQCSFVAGYIRRHPEYQDLLREN